MNEYNYYVVHTWMITKLNLKSVKLPLFAIVYESSKNVGSFLTAGTKYFQDITGFKGDAVRNNLRALESDGFITISDNGNKTSNYSIKHAEIERILFNAPIVELKEVPTPEILQNNQEPDEAKTVIEIKPIHVSVLEYLNEKLREKNPKKGFSMIDSNMSDIKTRIRTRGVKYTEADFELVIRYKIKQWYGKDKTEIWLRPSTLFGKKFDQYLAEAKANTSDTSDNNFTEADITENDFIE